MNRVYVAPFADCGEPGFGGDFAAHMRMKRNAEARRASAFAWSLLARALRDAGVVFLPSVAFSERGKPRLTDCGLHFSLSHSGGMAAVMISDVPCGVDIERVREMPRAMKERCMSAREADMDFFDVWTMKECMGKLTGDGLPPRPRETDIRDFRGMHRFMTLADPAGGTYRLCAICEGGEDIEIIKKD